MYVYTHTQRDFFRINNAHWLRGADPQTLKLVQMYMQPHQDGLPSAYGSETVQWVLEGAANPGHQIFVGSDPLMSIRYTLLFPRNALSLGITRLWSSGEIRYI